MTVGGLGLAFLAGMLSILSPCVLPLLPIILGGAAAKHRLAPAALAAGLAISFTALSLFVTTIGYALAIGEGAFRAVAAILLVVLGAAMLSPAIEIRFALAVGPVANWSERCFRGQMSDGLAGQFATGLLLGAVWSPCVGPTLGAVSLLIAQGTDPAGAALALTLLGAGAAMPLILIGLASRAALAHWRVSLLSTGQGIKRVIGAVLIALGLLTLTGLDRAFQTALVRLSPSWLTEFTTQF
jgi:cytochrome c biogenesis protein CcdA